MPETLKPATLKLTTTDLHIVRDKALAVLKRDGTATATRKRQLTKFLEAAIALESGLLVDESMAEMRGGA